jgi:hypothetical protein
MKDEDCDCVVEDLIEQSFSCIHFTSEKKVIEIGRPTPFFFTKMVKQRTGYAIFSDSWYKAEIQ